MNSRRLPKLLDPTYDPAADPANIPVRQDEHGRNLNRYGRLIHDDAYFRHLRSQPGYQGDIVERPTWARVRLVVEIDFGSIIGWLARLGVTVERAVPDPPG